MTKFRVRVRGRNSPNSPENTFVIIILRMLLIITLRIFTYSFSICDSSFYNVADIVLSVSDRAVNKTGRLPIPGDAGSQRKEVGV